MTTCTSQKQHFTTSYTPSVRPTAGKSLSVDEIYPQIFDAILEQRITPTSRFSEESLGQVFGVSRSIIRHVLARLSHQQVIILRLNHRPQVAAPDTDYTQQILHARRLTETTLIKLACQKATSDQLKYLRKLIAEERECMERDQRGKAIRLCGEFHLQLAEMAGNTPLTQFLGSLVPVTSLAIAQYEERDCSFGAWQEHAAIVDAVESCDVVTAVRLMNEHLDHLEEKMLRRNTLAR